MARVVNVMVVDDSAVMRQALTQVLGNDPEIEVIASAADPIFARNHMERQWPDVLVLDVEMPRMNGITFLKEIMSTHPTPVVIFSSLTTESAQTTMDAMSAGAVAYLTKPAAGLKQFIESEAAEIRRTVKGAASANIGRAAVAAASLASVQPRTARPVSPVSAHTLHKTTDRVVAIGLSTGGTLALEAVLRTMPALPVGVVVVQHMPELFTATYATRLDGICDARILEASDGDRVLPGHVLIAPGGKHMKVVRNGAQYCVKVSEGPRVNRHIPSVDVLFSSVAESVGANAMGVIMTGMGDDGAAGLRKMRDAGASTIGQDEQTCVVYGMPAAAKEVGAVQEEVPLDKIGAQIERFAGLS